MSTFGHSPLLLIYKIFYRDSIMKCKIFVLNSHHIFDARDLMADWGWGFTNPQPLPNPMLSRAKGNFQLAIQKKETEVSLRLTNFVLHMYKQLTSEQRSQIFVLLQKKIKRKELASYCRHKMRRQGGHLDTYREKHQHDTHGEAARRQASRAAG